MSLTLFKAPNSHRVTFNNDITGYVAGYRWRYRNHELEVQASNGRWVSHVWTGFHQAVDWAVEQRRLREYINMYQFDKSKHPNRTPDNELWEKVDDDWELIGYEDEEPKDLPVNSKALLPEGVPEPF